MTVTLFPGHGRGIPLPPGKKSFLDFLPGHQWDMFGMPQGANLLSWKRPMKGKAEFLEHTADLKIRFTAESLDELLTTAAWTLGEYLYGLKPMGGDKDLEVRVEGDSDAERLVASLNEMLYLLQSKRFLIVSVGARRDADAWRLSFSGRTTDLKPETEIKAATYHQVRYREFKDMAEAVVVFDL